MSKIGNWNDLGSGVRRKIFPPGQALMMMEVHFETGAVGTEHSHPHEQFTYCLKGKIEFKLDGKVTILQAGDTIAVPGGLKHSVKALEPSALLDTFTPLREDLLNS